jgi:hypothetical protein
MEKIRGNLASEKGLGRDLILKILGNVPGITEGSVRRQLAVLKSSGDYARIISEVTAEIERENAVAIAASKVSASSLLSS